MRRIAAMLASRRRAVCLAACMATGALAFAVHPAESKPTPSAAPAAKKKSAAAAPKPAARPAVAKPAPKPAPPPPPPPPPAVELIGMVVMPPDAFRGGPPSGQFDNEGRRAA